MTTPPYKHANRPGLLGNAKETSQKLLWYIVTVETTLILTIATGFFTVYQDLVTKEDLRVIAPYVQDRPVVRRFMQRTETTFEKIVATLERLDEKFTTQMHVLEIQQTKLEGRVPP